MLLLTFNLGGERYALESSRVVEVIPMVPLRKLPHAPDCVAGLFNYRGAVVPVLELRQLVQGGPCQPCLSTRIILVSWVSPKGRKSHTLGLMAERVTETVQKTSLDLSPPGITVEKAPYLGEIILGEGGMIQCLRLEHLLPDGLREALFQAEPADDPEGG